MKIGISHATAMRKWLFFVGTIVVMTTVSPFVYSDEHLGESAKAPMALTGMYVNDETVSVPVGAYTTFSTVYDGKRYYLGIDTTSAKAGKDTLAWYPEANYASMWVVGGLYNPSAKSVDDILANENYLRTIKSLWIEERCSRKKFLSLGADHGTYSALVLRDTAHSTMWYTEKDSREVNKYIQGYLYYYSDASGVDVYRYLTYNPLYGYCRAYSAKPSASQRISVWDRTRGNDITSRMTPNTYVFDLNTTADTVRLPITSHVYYYRDADRFRSRVDQVDVYARVPSIYDDQEGLTNEPYAMFGFYEWASNPRASLPTSKEALAAAKYNGHSLMPFYTITGITCTEEGNPETCTPELGWIDSTVLWVSDTKYKLDKVANIWYDTVFAIGTSPFDVLHKPEDASAPTAGDYAGHSDWLRQHFYVKNSTGVYEHFVDSIFIVRRTFHNAPYTKLNTSATPNDYVFPYSTSDAADNAKRTKTFTISGHYISGNDVLYVNNSIAQTTIGEERDLDLTTRTCYRDTIWKEGEGGKPEVDHIVLYDTLLVEALLEDGSSAIVSDPSAGAGAWITAVTLTAKNQIKVDVEPSVVANRMAQIRYIYRYRHSSAEGDWAESIRSIWISQKGSAGSSTEVYSFSHKDESANLQPVHEKKYTLYAIPGEELQLLLHRDHWGYYRWFIYDEANRERDIEYNATWSWGNSNTNKPENALGEDYMVINHTTDEASKGQWDVIKDVKNPSNTMFSSDHFVPGTATSIPTIDYPESNSKNGQIACEVSAYYDIDPTGEVGKSLSKVIEPTLSYRQIFDIQPAKTQADKMADCRVNGGEGHNGYMEEHTVIVPAGQAFTLLQQYPVLDANNGVVQRDHLQYIYYFNTTGTPAGANMGVKGSSDDTKSASFSRIGVKREIRETNPHVELLKLSDLSAMNVGQNQKKTIIIVNPRKESGYVLGNKSGYDGLSIGSIGGATDKSTLEAYLNSHYLNQSDYIFTIEKNSDGTFTIKRPNSTRSLTIYYGAIPAYGWTVRWPEPIDDRSSNKITMTTPFETPGSDFIVTSTNSLLRWHMSGSRVGGSTHSGYVAANEYYNKAWVGTDYAYRNWTSNAWGKSYELQLQTSDYGSDANIAWCVYEIKDEVVSIYEETPVWEYSTNGSDWSEVAREGTSNSNYRMTEEGNLRVSATQNSGTPATVYYRLRTQHFLLAKFTVATRNAAEEGPTTSAIIPEDDILNNYDILQTLGNELFPAPGTTDVTAYNHLLPWSYTELSYHYPRTGDGAIEDDKRVFTTDLPAAGEYAYLNKFEKSGHTTNAMAGASNGYMLCIHTSEKPVTILNFVYPQLPCSDQELFLTFNLCNPMPETGYNPQITADMEGKVGDGAWTPIYRFKTGEVQYKGDNVWQQFVLPIQQSLIADKDSFRCVARLTGSSEDDAYLLIDRLRFIAKARPMSVFQNKTTCLDNNEVDLVARFDYQHSSVEAGTIVAIQYQKLNKSTHVFEPISGLTYTNQIFDNNGADCGYITIPAANFIPEVEDTTTLDDVITKTISYVNEGHGSPYWVMFISHKVSASAEDSLRVAMAIIPTTGTPPNFSTSGCASERIVTVKTPVTLHVNGATGAWANSTAEEDKVSPNETYRLTVGLQNLPAGARAGSGRAKFDMLRSDDDDRNYLAKLIAYKEDPTNEAKKKAVEDADAWFLRTYGLTRARLLDYLETFRADNEANPYRLTTNWNDVRSEGLMWSGRSKTQADSIYNILNRLIVIERKLEIGRDYYDAFLGSNDQVYLYIQPLPASGTFINSTGETEAITVCNTPQWFEIHSQESNFSLRFGYDHIIDGDYQVPIIRASKTDANEHLKVRIADITHAATAGVVIGWDSTYVIESNDPEWNPATKTFRYHQDRIVQDNIYDEYYKVPAVGAADIDNRYITFTPVNSDYIARLTNTDCGCYDYDPAGTVYNYNKATKSFTTDETNGVFKVPATTTTGCNEWLVKPGTYNGHPTPGYQTPNNFTLKAGYWYKFKTAFFDVSGGNRIWTNVGGDGTCHGHAEFILAVAPDTVRWTPSHPESANFWNDDDNWTAVVNGTDYHGAIATIPMSDSRVIIPSPEAENMLPIVSTDNANVIRRIDTLDYGFVSNTCRDILFKPNARMLGQEKLDYTRAFVDVVVKTANWQTFAPALTNIYSGDIYVPQNAANGDDPDFAPAMFETGAFNAGHNRFFPYVFYQAYYNSTVKYAFSNTDEEGAITQEDRAPKNSAEWVKTNVLDKAIQPGTAVALLGFGPTDVEDSALIVRLPKQENTYSYIAVKTYNTQTVDISRPEFTSISHNLAYDKTSLSLAGGAGITYRLTNEQASKVFFFGNPTMALVDVYKLCEDNILKLEHTGERQYKFTTYQMREGSTYTTEVVDGPGKYFIAPHRAVGLIAADEGTTLDVLLKPSAMVALTGAGTPVHETADAPLRRLANDLSTTPDHQARLYVAASNETNQGLFKAYLTVGEETGATRGFTVGEDVLSLSSGLEYYDEAAFSTPLSMYTIADNRALMLDIRDTLQAVPLVFATLEDKLTSRGRPIYSYSDVTMLSFALTGDWERPLYLFDALTGDSIMIVNGLQIGIQTPQSDQIRYYINGTARAAGSEDTHPGISTDLEVVNAPMTGDQMVNNQIANVYDVLGRRVAVLGDNDLINKVQLPTGVYIICRGNKTERVVIR